MYVFFFGGEGYHFETFINILHHFQLSDLTGKISDLAITLSIIENKFTNMFGYVV